MRTCVISLTTFALLYFSCLQAFEVEDDDLDAALNTLDAFNRPHIRSERSAEATNIKRKMIKRRRKRPIQIGSESEGPILPPVKIESESDSEETALSGTVRKVLRRKSDLKPLKVIEAYRNNVTNLEAISQRERDARFFSLFTVVRFNNDECETSSGENGTCYTSSDCSSRGGNADGVCASGFGVCCFFRFECGRSTSDNGTYFVNPPTTQRICNLMINRMNDEICQIRLDFKTFDISDPNAEGKCTTDFFLVTGGSPVPQLCGTNTGQHVIYSITSNSGPTQISMVMDTTVTASSSRQWIIRILQYECSSRVLAPVGCLQYYLTASGMIQSFNYKTDVRANGEPNHLANLNYAICIRVDNGYCGIRYAQPTSDPFSFTLSRDASTTILAFPLPATGVKYGDVDCQSDYILIPGGSEDGLSPRFARDRFCGISLGSCMGTTPTATTCMAVAGAVTTYSKPFIVQVITDNEEGIPVVDKANRGFRLTYNQQPCLRGR